MNLQEIEKKVVFDVVQSFDESWDWQAAILDYELREVSDGYDSDYVAIILLRSPDGALTQDQFLLRRDARKTCIDLYKSYRQGANPDMVGFILRVEADGKYRFDFKNELRRLAGIWDAEAQGYYDNYLAHYQREMAGES